MTTPRKTRQAARSNPPTEKASAVVERPCGSSKTKKADRRGTKQAVLIALLERPKGATIAQMCAKTGWQAHSVRAALTGLRKRGLGIRRGTNNAGKTVYLNGSQSDGSTS